MKRDKQSKKTRVVAYARVSTDQQVKDGNSLENQRTYFTRELAKNDDFVLVSLPTNDGGIYADAGVSGTKLSRPAFDRMLKDAGLTKVIDEDTGKETSAYKIAAKPKFDVIFVKDTTRFARNVSVNSLLQLLKDNGVLVHFLDLGKTTESNEDMTYIQIFLSFGERESRDRSRKVQFGYAEGARQGNIYMGGGIIGYDYVKKDKKDPYNTNILRANKDAELVRLVFDLYTEQEMGHQQICKELARRGYFNAKGNQYTRSTISRMLKNEKYVGVNTAGQYTWGEDLFSKKLTEREYDDDLRVQAREATQRLADEGVVTRIEPIISREQFDKAQAIREQNRAAVNNDCSYHGVTPFARKIKCGRCGAWYTSQSRKYTAQIKCENCGALHIEQIEKPKRKVKCRKCGEYYTVPSRDTMIDKCKVIRYYACGHRFAYDEEHGIDKCNNPSIREDELDELLNSSYYYENRLNSIDEIQGAGELCIEALEAAIDTDNDAHVVKIQAEIDRLTDERNNLLPLYAKKTYPVEVLDEMTDGYNSQINTLTAQKSQLAKTNDELRADITQVRQLMDAAQEEEAEIREALKTREFPKRDRKHQLKDVDYISIDVFGTPTIVFKSLNEIQRTIDYIDSITATYRKNEEQPETGTKKTLKDVLDGAGDMLKKP